MTLPSNERRVLEAVCETLLPALEPEPGDNAALCALDAATLGVPDAMEQALSRLPLDSWLRIRLLLRALEQPAAMRLLAGRAAPFSRLQPQERERALLGLAGSRIGALRGGLVRRSNAWHAFCATACPDPTAPIRPGSRSATTYPSTSGLLRQPSS